ncbi:MAG: hypothetical protein ACRD96_01340 [Bryobacteraceae bacterium]
MDVERTIEFILDQQAKSAAWQAKSEACQARTDRRIEAITKLIHAGMKMIAKNQQEIKEVRELHNETSRLMREWLKRNPNGGSARR